MKKILKGIVGSMGVAGRLLAVHGHGHPSKGDGMAMSANAARNSRPETLTGRLLSTPLAALFATWRVAAPSVARQRRGSVRGVVAMALLAAGLQASPAWAQLTGPLSCAAVYAVDSSGDIYATTNAGVQTLVRSVGGATNPFGISSDGAKVFVATAAGEVRVYDAVANTTTTASAAVTGAPGSFNMGAVNPVNGRFYIAAANVANRTATELHLYVYDEATPTLAPVKVAIVTGIVGNNGDIAFDSQGNLYALTGNIVATASPQPNYIFRAGQVPVALPLLTLPATQLATVPVPAGASSGNAGGIAFNAAGQLMTSEQVSRIRLINPLTGAEMGNVPASANAISDLASCAGGSTITLQKDLPQGRVVAADQFTLQLSNAGLSPNPATATTAGTSSGLQTQRVGPFLAFDGTSFTINEAASGGTTLTNYVRSWRCVDAAATPVVDVGSGTTLPATVTIPSAGNGASVVCTITNAHPVIRLQKSLPNGRVVAGNQFLLRIAGAPGADITATTTGATNTPAEVAIKNAVVGTSYTLSESAAGTPATVLANYITTYACTNTLSGGQVPNGVGTSFTVVPVAGDDLTCTFTNRPAPTLRLDKTWVNATLNNAVTVSVTSPATGSTLASVANTANETDPGTAFPVAYGVAYTITEAFTTGVPGNYVKALTCTGNSGTGANLNYVANALSGTITLGDTATAVVCTFTNTRPPIVTATKAASVSPLVVGQSGQWYTLSITIANGPTTAALTIDDTLPTGITLSGAPTLIAGSTTGTLSGCPSSGSSTSGCSVASGVANGTFTVRIPVNVAATAIGASGGTNTANLSGGGDPLCTSATGQACDPTTPTTPVRAMSADLSIVKSNAGTTYTPGTTGSYTLTVRNNGTDAVTGAEINDSLPTGITLNGAITCSVSGGGSCGANTGTPPMISVLLNLSVGAVATITIPVQYASTP